MSGYYLYHNSIFLYISIVTYIVSHHYCRAFGAYVDKKGHHNKNFGRTVIWKHFQVIMSLI
jgi:hypothetical protein